MLQRAFATAREAVAAERAKMDEVACQKYRSAVEEFTAVAAFVGGDEGNFILMKCDELAKRAASIEAKRTPKQKRFKIARELLETESAYRKALELLETSYMIPLEAILEPSQHKTVFHGVREILALSRSFEDELSKIVSTWDVNKSCLGSSFLKYAPFFKTYTPFTNGFEAAQRSLVRNDSLELKEFLSKTASELNGETLSSLLIRPVQRLPRYVLFLKELQKSTPPEHPDSVDSALTEISSIASLVNSRMKEHEAYVEVLNLQNALWSPTQSIPVLVTPGRCLLKRGKLHKVRSSGKRTNQRLVCFLLSDLFVYTKQLPKIFEAEKFQFQRALSFKGCARCADVENALKITGDDGVRIFVAKTAQERDEWLDAINDALHKSDEKRKSLRLGKSVSERSVLPDEVSDYDSFSD